ncbi:signal peptide peptidase SppA [Herbivorax sp. ANBcel31]|uniref:signal peptide peptidase SppA n=1 Tax=Herbivorax sp. ANBcel31 TaxID=3069754 RepID=UPI0027B38FDC|nr:signal peptide peptidase SppA [Herbivorax sp. ANBcel31]MDQ2086593.1 signal peptide peptidase SppA [Herbivorax sp. ANBcel31]
MNTKRWIAVGVFCGLLFIQLLSSFMTTDDGISGVDFPDWSTELYSRGTRGNIALLDIDGIIQGGGGSSFLYDESYRHESFLDQLEHAFTSSNIDGVVLQVNSPGGGIYESDEIYNKIISLKEENDKPFVVYMKQLAASGGYYVSAPADKIYANRNTITGSIGVAMGGINYKELLDNIGVKDNIFTSGDNKTILSPSHEMTDEQAKIVQSMVDEMYEQFLDVVMSGRDIGKSTLKSIADGRVYTARQAKEVGLIDEIGSLDDAIEKVSDIAELENPSVLRYKYDDLGFLSGFGVKISDAIFSKNLHNVKEIEKMFDIRSALPMYLWEQ